MADKKLYFRIGDDGEYKLATLNGKNKGVWNGVAWDNAPEPPTTYTITPTLIDVTADPNNPTTIQSGGEATLTFTSDYGYNLPDIITVTGAPYDWVKSTGTLTLSSPETDVAIRISGVLKDDYCTIRTTLTGVTAYSRNPTIIQKGATETFTFTADSGYNLPDRDAITVVGGTFSWNKLTGTMILAASAQNPKNLVTISMSGVPIQTGETWQIKESGLSYVRGATYTTLNFTIDFTSNGRNFTNFILEAHENFSLYSITYRNGLDSYEEVYKGISWLTGKQGYRTVYFPVPPTDIDVGYGLRSWLEENAVKQ